MKALIIDDEEKARDVLLLQLQFHIPEITTIWLADGAEKATQLLMLNQPDVVFLDIKMPRVDGFTWLKSLKQYNFHVIFTTAYDQYAIKAIRFAAFDYLLKPVNAEELRIAIDRLLVEKEREQKYFDNLFYNTSQNNQKNYRLTIATTEGTHFLDPDLIIRCEADGNYTHFFMDGGNRIVASRPLGHFIELLEGADFIRCHKSHLVNIKFVVKIGEKGLTLNEGSLIEVSRRRRVEVKNRLAASGMSDQAN